MEFVRGVDIAGKILTNIKCDGIFFGVLSKNSMEMTKKDKTVTFHIQGSHPKSIQTPLYGEIHGCHLNWLDYSKELTFKINFSIENRNEDDNETWSLFALPINKEIQNKPVFHLDATDEEFLDKGLSFRVKSKNHKRKFEQTSV